MICRNTVGNIYKAIEAYKKSILFNPVYVEAYNNLGVTLQDKEK